MRLAITGLGAVSPQGVGREPIWEAFADAAEAEKRAFGSPTVLGSEVLPDVQVAEVWDWDAARWLGKKGHRNFDRLTKFLIVAGKHALEDAGLKKDGAHVRFSPDRVGICSATAYGSLDAIHEVFKITELEDPRYINPTRFPNTVINAAAGYVSIWEDLRAPNTTVVNGNCGALDAVLIADTHIAHGRGDAFLVGGGEVISAPLFFALQRLGIICADDGVCMGEGAAFGVIEELDAARARGANVLGVIRGYGSAFAPPERDAQLVHGSAQSITQAVELALEDAQLDASAIDAVASARSGLAQMDSAEREALETLFGPDIAVGAPKKLFGETFGVAGAFGVGAGLAWLGGAPVGPLVRGRLPSEVESVVVTAVGFYGNASAVVLTRDG